MRQKKSKLKDVEPVTQAEIDEGLALLRGEPVFQFEKPSEQLVVKEDGGYELAKTPGWIKFSTAFRKKMLKELKGARLSVFMCICLHVNENGESFPSVATMSEETGYNKDTIMLAVAEIEALDNLMDVVKQHGKKNIYHPYFAAYGKHNEPHIPELVGKIRPVVKNTSSGFHGKLVQKITTSLRQTSSENLDTKKKEKLRRINIPLSVENQIFAGVEQIVPLEIDLLKQAITDSFGINVRWGSKAAPKNGMSPADFEAWMFTEKITVEQVQRAGKVWVQMKKYGWRTPTLYLIWENWNLLLKERLEDERADPKWAGYEYKPIGGTRD